MLMDTAAPAELDPLVKHVFGHFRQQSQVVFGKIYLKKKVHLAEYLLVCMCVCVYLFVYLVSNPRYSATGNPGSMVVSQEGDVL